MKTVLIIDDDHEIHELLTFNLEKAGFHVICADNAERGIGLATSPAEAGHAPDVIILDLMLPGIEGMTAAKCLTEHEMTKYIPIIILSARLTEADIEVGKKLGIKAFFDKPFSIKELIAKCSALDKSHFSDGH